MNCDIVIPVWNQLSFTKDCVDSIIKNTYGVNYRLILVDNASNDDTRIYLGKVKETKPEKVMVLRNDKNLGYIKAANQGIAASDAGYVLLLNNDTLVTKGWLKEMIDIAASAEDIGIVNPSSNNLGQKPAAGEPIEIYAEKVSKESGKTAELGSAIGFCMLIKRELIEKIGALDEVYGMGNFDDTDFSRRAAQAGYKCVRACGAYVFHRENTSFNKVTAFDEDFKRNKEIYEFRWGKPRRIAYILGRIDESALKKINADSISLARSGNWIWYFMRDPIVAPRHSNIIIKYFPGFWFYPMAVFGILKRKKRFSEIYVREAVCAKLLGALGFIHRAKVINY